MPAYPIVSSHGTGVTMSDITTEQKLQLVQQVRSRYKEDRYDMHRREHILYGREFPVYEESEGYPEARVGGSPAPSSLRGRLIVAVMLFIGLVVLQENQVKIAGITSEKIYEMISADYETQIDKWIESFSRQVANDPSDAK